MAVNDANYLVMLCFMLVTNSLTNWLTHSVTCSRLDGCEWCQLPGDVVIVFWVRKWLCNLSSAGKGRQTLDRWSDRDNILFRFCMYSDFFFSLLNGTSGDIHYTWDEPTLILKVDKRLGMKLLSNIEIIIEGFHLRSNGYISTKVEK